MPEYEPRTTIFNDSCEIARHGSREFYPSLRAALAKAQLGILLLAAGCGGSGAAGKADENALAARNLYPFKESFVWSHEVDTGSGPPTLAISRVISIRDNVVEISTGSDPLVYELRDDGIWNRSRDGWLLKDPIEPGRSWESAPNVNATIVRAGFSMQTKGGEFAPCAEIEERTEDPPKHTLTTFCVGVGPVQIRSTMQLPTQGEATVTARLLGFATGDEL